MNLNNTNCRPTTDDWHQAAVELKNNIEYMRKQVYTMNKLIAEQTRQLDEICPHRDTKEEYDDDFHKPRSYTMCVLCRCDV